ncbi:UDP-N-acetylglucosamine:LPS N-acetylglucosamine transferase [Evansella vedderi]|uniref:UDP-N-acetylglucosamine:LPS N-acetylglucosamine transferase n=1 Tax=Evansella vedderi TaxID=38282 RepID=A0ABT9ZSG0_9BACI|nr:hypothetical protein [Evansella vedderi]MDQ0253910.1 UDP-N-acetylglucosamine:LPS N-acetylglucosamine transferase [Evansella vedderi]
MSKRMVIFTVSVGQGHHQVSKALQEEWEERGYKADIVDIFSYMKKRTAFNMKKAYFYSIYSVPKLWDWTYQFTNCKAASWLLSPLLRIWWKKLLSFCEQESYEIIVTTHPLASQIGLMIKKNLSHKPKLFAVLTDFSTHCLSISKEMDAIFVAEKAELEKLRKKNPQCTFYSYGIPLRKKWDEPVEKELYQKKLNLPFSKKVLVIAGGGRVFTQRIKL